MARFIPLHGPISDTEEELAILMKVLHGKYCSFMDLENGQKLLSQLDTIEINQTATDIAGGPIYGDAILYHLDELNLTKGGGGNAGFPS